MLSHLQADHEIKSTSHPERRSKVHGLELGLFDPKLRAVNVVAVDTDHVGAEVPSDPRPTSYSAANVHNRDRLHAIEHKR